MSKLAVIFPGIGYLFDRPLLYYSRKLAVNLGYEIVPVYYSGFEKGMKGSKEKMLRAFDQACLQTQDILKSVNFTDHEDIVFISKSIGTAVAADYALRNAVAARQILYTPVDGTVHFLPELKKSGARVVAFSGTADPWVTPGYIEKAFDENAMPLQVVEGANHSLESGNVIEDIGTLQKIMRITESFLREIRR